MNAMKHHRAVEQLFNLINPFQTIIIHSRVWSCTVVLRLCGIFGIISTGRFIFTHQMVCAYIWEHRRKTLWAKMTDAISVLHGYKKLG